MKFFLPVLIIAIICSCEAKKVNLIRYDGTKQFLSMNNLERNGKLFTTPSIIKLSTDSVKRGEEFLAKIFLDKGDLKLVDAFIDCELVEDPSVDTLTYKVSGCSTGLLVRNDTILIGFYPTKLGVLSFPEITLLTKDKENVFRTMQYSFKYKVVE